MMEFAHSINTTKGESMNIITVGIDLAKNVFAVHGVDDNGKPALVKPKVSRADFPRRPGGMTGWAAHHGREIA